MGRSNAIRAGIFAISLLILAAGCDKKSDPAASSSPTPGAAAGGTAPGQTPAAAAPEVIAPRAISYEQYDRVEMGASSKQATEILGPGRKLDAATVATLAETWKEDYNPYSVKALTWMQWLDLKDDIYLGFAGDKLTTKVRQPRRAPTAP